MQILKGLIMVKRELDADKIERKLEEKGIFGSFIRGEETASSDIDVLIEYEKASERGAKND